LVARLSLKYDQGPAGNKDLTQERLAELVGVTQKTINTGERYPERSNTSC
jgi:hypothetical protein